MLRDISDQGHNGSNSIQINTNLTQKARTICSQSFRHCCSPRYAVVNKLLSFFTPEPTHCAEYHRQGNVPYQSQEMRVEASQNTAQYCGEMYRQRWASLVPSYVSIFAMWSDLVNSTSCDLFRGALAISR